MKVALGNNMLFTYVFSFIVLLIPMLLLSKFLFYFSIEETLVGIIFIAGYSIILSMQAFLKQLKLIIKNAYSKK